MLVDEWRQIFQLAQRDSLLAHNVVGGGEVEEQVGKDEAAHVVAGGQLGLLGRPHAKGDDFIDSFVDDVLVGLGQELQRLIDAVEEFVKGLEVVLKGEGFDARSAGNELLGKVGSKVDLERKREHVLEDAGFWERSGIWGFRALLEDVLKAFNSLLSHGDGSVVEAVSGHGGGGGYLGLWWRERSDVRADEMLSVKDVIVFTKVVTKFKERWQELVIY